MAKSAKIKTGAPQSKNSKPKKNRHLSKELVGRKKKWIYWLIVATLPVIAGLALKYYYSKPEYVRMNHIIRQYVSFALQLQQTEVQMSILLAEDPYVDIMKTGLRPIQDRVTSLRTQTSQYEKMEQIPGGPTHFMASSLKELDVIVNTKLTQLSLESLVILGELSRRTTNVKKSFDELLIRSSALQGDSFIEMMMLENVILVPSPMLTDSEKVEALELSQKMTLNETINVLNDLAALYDQMDMLYNQAQDWAIQLGVGSLDELTEIELPDEAFDAILPVMEQLQAQRDKILEVKKKKKKYFQTFALLKERIRQNITVMMDSIQNYEEEKRHPFVKLHEMIMKDIKNLRIRIDNLKYKYAKRSPEL